MILIAGATGYIGRYLAVDLKKRGKDVLALGRNPKVAAFFGEQGIPFLPFDLLNDADYDQLPTDGIEAIVNLAVCLPEHEAPMERFFDVNTKGNYKLLEFARKHRVTRFIMASTHKVYYDVYKPLITEQELPNFIGPHSPYVISKLAAENFMQYYGKDFGMDTIVLRFTGVHGYGALMGFLKKDGSYSRTASEWFIEKAVKGEPIEVWGDQSIRRDHVYIKDVVSAIEASINAPMGTKGIYNVASGIAHNQYEDAVAISKAFATDQGMSEIILRPDKPGLTRGYCYSIAKMKQDMNWTPTYTDLGKLYADYKQEWQKKTFHNYHYIKPQDKPISFD
ncbi:MAG: NAD(P)-dependent oxidoreductase [Clostridia bacterium]